MAIAKKNHYSFPLKVSYFNYFNREPLEIQRIKTEFHRKECEVNGYDFLGEGNHYSSSFGWQWHKYRNVQIDRLNGTKASYNHLLSFCQGDLSIFKGATCLEIGSGAGRFTDYLIDLCKTVISVDSSSAIFHNVALGASNLIACRADLFDIPIQPDSVDIVFCRGVIQHTPSPRQAVKKLFSYVRNGGKVLFDVYPFKWYTPFVTKYWIRPFIKNLSSETLAHSIEDWVPQLLWFKKNFVNEILPRNKFGVHLSNQIVPIVDATTSNELSSWEHKIQWSILDTIDMYTPRYDNPMTFRSIVAIIEDLGTVVQADPSTFCFKAVKR